MVSLLLIKSRRRAVYPEQPIKTIISGHLKNEFCINTFQGFLTQNDEQSLKLLFYSSHVKDGISVSRIHGQSSKMPCLQQLPRLMFCLVNTRCSEISAGAAEGEVAQRILQQKDRNNQPPCKDSRDKRTDRTWPIWKPSTHNWVCIKIPFL